MKHKPTVWNPSHVEITPKCGKINFVFWRASAISSTVMMAYKIFEITWNRVSFWHNTLHWPWQHCVLRLKFLLVSRHWPEVYDLCHTFLHIVLVKKPTAMQESRAILAWQCDSRMAIGFLTCARCKNMQQNLIPLATAYWSGVLEWRHSVSIKGFLPRFCAFSKFLVVAQRTGSSSTALAWQPWHSKSLSYSLLVGLSNLLEKE